MMATLACAGARAAAARALRAALAALRPATRHLKSPKKKGVSYYWAFN
jgi:hypothetical protein